MKFSLAFVHVFHLNSSFCYGIKIQIWNSDVNQQMHIQIIYNKKSVGDKTISDRAKSTRNPRFSQSRAAFDFTIYIYLVHIQEKLAMNFKRCFFDKR